MTNRPQLQAVPPSGNPRRQRRAGALLGMRPGGIQPGRQSTASLPRQYFQELYESLVHNKGNYGINDD